MRAPGRGRNGRGGNNIFNNVYEIKRTEWLKKCFFEKNY